MANTLDYAPLSAPLSDRRALGPWLAAEFGMSYASMLLLTGCYDYAKWELHASPSQRLWISASWGFAYIFFSFLGGRVTEKFGSRASSSWLCGLSVATCLIGLLALAFPLIWVIPLILIPFNLTCTMIWPAIESGLTRSPARMPLARRISYYNLAWGSAGFLATFTHGMLESWWYGLIFVVPAAVCGLAGLTLGVLAVPASMIGTHNVPDTGAGEQELDDPAVRRRAGRLLKMAWITNPLAYMAIYVLIPVMADLCNLAGVSDLGLAGMLGSIWFVVRFVGFAVAGRWTGWHYKIRWQIGPLVALTGALAAMLLVHNLVVLIACQVVFGAAAAVLYSASLYYAMHVSSGHGGHAAFHEAVIGIGTTAGPLIGAVASTGQSGRAMAPIALGVSALLIAGLAVILWMALGQKSATIDPERTDK
jgi:MFS family permease